MTPDEIDAFADRFAQAYGAALDAAARLAQHADSIRAHAAEVMGVPGDPLEDWTLEDLMNYADLCPLVEPEYWRTGPRYRSDELKIGT